MAKKKTRVTNGGGREKEAMSPQVIDRYVKEIERFTRILFADVKVHYEDQRLIQQALVRRIKQRIG